MIGFQPVNPGSIPGHRINPSGECSYSLTVEQVVSNRLGAGSIPARNLYRHGSEVVKRVCFKHRSLGFAGSIPARVLSLYIFLY